MKRSKACCSFMARRWARKWPQSHPRLGAKFRNRSVSRPEKQPRKLCKRPSRTIRASDKMHGSPAPANDFSPAEDSRRTARSNRRNSRNLSKTFDEFSLGSSLRKTLLDLDVHAERAVLVA